MSAELRQAVVFAARFEYFTQRFEVRAGKHIEVVEWSELERRAGAEGLSLTGSSKVKPIPNLARVREYWADVLPVGTALRDYPPEWCGGFCLFALHRAELGLDVFWRGGFAAKHLRVRPVGELPEPGDVAYFTRNQHHAIVESVDATARTFDSIDGNQPAILRHAGRSLDVVHAFYSISPLIEAKEAKHGPEV